MPDTAVALEKLKLRNCTDDPRYETCANQTKVIVVTPGDLTIGGRFRASIQAYNCIGEAKTHGGDYFRARLVRFEDVGGGRPNGVACHITDHRNGTYSAESPLPIPGKLVFELVLVYSAEGIAQLVSATSRRRYSGTSYIGKYENNVTAECNVDLTTHGL
ncbi:NXPE family member 3-like [Ciona intestinalis]